MISVTLSVIDFSVATASSCVTFSRFFSLYIGDTIKIELDKGL